MAATELQEAERGPRMFSVPDVLWRVRVQPAAELRHLQRHNHAKHVLRALLPEPCSQSAVGASLTRCVRRGRPAPPPAASKPVARTAPYILRSILGRTRGRSTSRSELRHLRRHNHALHVPGALLPVPCPNQYLHTTIIYTSTLPRTNFGEDGLKTLVGGLFKR